MKLTVKKVENVATSFLVSDEADLAGPWKEAKIQCL